MKRILALLLALITAALCALPLQAAECEHNYIRSAVAANCTDKAHMLYLCRKCGHSYKVYNDEYELPEGIYLLAKSERNEESATLTVTVELGNNPGLIASRLCVGYNGATLSLREYINGSVWSENDYTAKVNIENNPVCILTEDYTTGVQNNTNSGLYFTLVFDIIDPDGSYNMYFSSSNNDFHSWDEETGSIVPHPPTVISIVGKSELGDHSYVEETTLPTCTEGGATTYTCEFCLDSYTTETTEPLGHDWSLLDVTKEPTLKEEGMALYTCTTCGEWKMESIPTLTPWTKGDLNNDGQINSIDSNLMKRFLVGVSATEQAIDAADLDLDGRLNAMDAFLLKLKVSGN
ncbi:MAG: hypothetical protein E7647_07545 [Ruminococcaceae bacterium]|nr:hypothetical protein [Oscillospiraceae bacterium]